MFTNIDSENIVTNTNGEEITVPAGSYSLSDCTLYRWDGSAIRVDSCQPKQIYVS